MRWVILDRDGVINADSPDFIRSAAQWQPIPGSIEAIAAFTAAGWRVTVATNQSGIARGLFSEATLAQIHQRMIDTVVAAGGRIEAIAYCPHGPDDGCRCRKPQPGLYLELAARLGAPLLDVPVIGDSGRDLEAARRVGAQPLLVRTGKGESTANRGDAADCPIYPDLAAATAALLGAYSGEH